MCLHFAPFNTFSMVLRKRGKDDTEALVVAPLWITQSLWPQLAHLIMDFPIKLPPAHKNIVSAKQPRKNSSKTKTETGGISLIRECRGIQGELAYLIIQAWRQSSKRQYECYLRTWLKFAGSPEIAPL